MPSLRISWASLVFFLGHWVPGLSVPGLLSLGPAKTNTASQKNDTAAKQKTMIAAEKTDDSSNYQTHRGNMVLTGPGPSLFWAFPGPLPSLPLGIRPLGPPPGSSLAFLPPLGSSHKVPPKAAMGEKCVMKLLFCVVDHCGFNVNERLRATANHKSSLFQ